MGFAFFLVSQSEAGVQNDASLADAGIVSLTIPLTGADLSAEGWRHRNSQ